MRNLKRALSLTLASVMLLGMMVLGTSAVSYPDVDENDNVEAIEVLQAVGVMSGSNNGNFNPDAKISRIEMAIVMANLLNLNVDYFEGQNSFSDVPAWAAKYVSACEANGIVSGVGGGRFGTGNVTATQAALMMLKALGYFQYNSDFGGDWARATALQAARIDLFKGLTVANNTQLTRNQVAQLALNALQATMVDAEDNTLNINTGAAAGNISISGGSVKYVVRASSNRNVAGAISAVETSGSSTSGINGYTVELGEQLYQGDLKRTEVSDDLENPAVRWVYKTQEIGKYAKEPALTYLKEVKIKDIYADLGLSGTFTNGSDNKTVKFAVNGNTSATANDGTSSITQITSTDPGAGALKIGGKGAVTKVYHETKSTTSGGSTVTNETITITVTNYYLAKALEDYNSSDKDVDVDVKANGVGVKTLKADDFANVVNVRKDDYLVVTLDATDTNAIKSVAPADVIADTVVSVARSDDYATIGGQKYEYSDISEKDTGALGKALMNGAETYDLNGDGYNAYLDPNGYVLGIEKTDGGLNVSQYLYVKEKGTNVFDVAIKALFSDGSTRTVTVDKVNNSGTEVDATTSNVETGRFYKFTVKSDGSYRLTAISEVPNVSELHVTDKDVEAKVNPIEDNSAQYADDTTVFISKDKVTTGVKNTPKIISDVSAGKQNDVHALYSTATGSNNRLLLVYSTQTGSVEVSVEDLTYILEKKSEVNNADGTEYYVYKAWKNGEMTEIAANQNGKPAGLYKIETYTDGRADLGDKISVTKNYEWVVVNNVSSYSYSNSVLNVSGQGYYLKDGDSAKVYSIDGTTVKTLTPSSLSTTTATSDKFNTCILVREKDEANANIAVVYIIKDSANVAVLAAREDGTARKSSEILAFLEGTGASKTVQGPVEIDSSLTVPAGKTLILEGVTTIKDNQTLTVRGTVELKDSITAKDGGKVVLTNGDLIMSGDTATLVPPVEGTGNIAVNGSNIKVSEGTGAAGVTALATRGDGLVKSTEYDASEAVDGAVIRRTLEKATITLSGSGNLGGFGGSVDSVTESTGHQAVFYAVNTKFAAAAGNGRLETYWSVDGETWAAPTQGGTVSWNGAEANEEVSGWRVSLADISKGHNYLKIVCKSGITGSGESETVAKTVSVIYEIK